MKDELLSCIEKTFDELIKKYDFFESKYFFDDSVFYFELKSTFLTIKLEKYRNEFYLTFLKENDPDNEVNLFNLLAYLNNGDSNIPTSKYFEDEENLEQRYKLQIEYLATITLKYFEIIKAFFTSSDFHSEIKQLNKFLLTKYPYLYGNG